MFEFLNPLRPMSLPLQQCAICNKTLKNECSRLECDHIFHRFCWKGWINPKDIRHPCKICERMVIEVASGTVDYLISLELNLEIRLKTAMRLTATLAVCVLSSYAIFKHFF